MSGIARLVRRIRARVWPFSRIDKMGNALWQARAVLITAYHDQGIAENDCARRVIDHKVKLITLALGDWEPDYRR